VRKNITERRESAHTTANIRLQRVGHISLCALFDNVTMYQNYIHDITAKHVVNMLNVIKRKSFIILTSCHISVLAFFIACSFSFFSIIYDVYIYIYIYIYIYKTFFKASFCNKPRYTLCIYWEEDLY